MNSAAGRSGTAQSVVTAERAPAASSALLKLCPPSARHDPAALGLTGTEHRQLDTVSEDATGGDAESLTC